MKLEIELNDELMDEIMAKILKEHHEMIINYIEILENLDYMSEAQDEDWHANLKFAKALETVYHYFTGEKL